MEVECNGELYLGSGAKLVGRLLAEKSVNRRCTAYIRGGGSVTSGVFWQRNQRIKETAGGGRGLSRGYNNPDQGC